MYASGLVDGSAYWLKTTLTAATGKVDVSFAADQTTEPTAWTTIASQAGLGATSIANVNAPLEVGSAFTGSSNLAAAKFYRAIVRNGIGGTTVFDADFTSGITSGAQTTFTESSANAATVTINRSTSGRKSVAVVRPVWLLGTDDFFEVADNALLDFGASDSFTVVAVVRQWATPASFGRYVDKTQASDGAGYRINNNDTTIGRQYLVIDDGPTFTNTQSGASNSFTAGQLVAIAGVRDTAADTIRSFNNGLATSAAVTDTTTGSLANTGALRIGAGSAGNYQDFELLAVAVFRRALTAAELATIATYYGAV